MANTQLHNQYAKSIRLFGMRFDLITAQQVLELMKTRSEESSFGFVATPNVQHVVDASRNTDLGVIYERAMLSVCDSQPVRFLSGLLGVYPPLVTGSDLTISLFKEVLKPGDRISVICASEHLADELRANYDWLDWQIMVPPADTNLGTPAFDECIRFIKEARARFAFICLGAPKSEQMCVQLSHEADVVGTALCTGAALEFLLGHKRRAPWFFRRNGIEWMYRLVTEPRRLWRRYVFAFIPLLRLFIAEIWREKPHPENQTSEPASTDKRWNTNEQ